MDSNSANSQDITEPKQPILAARYVRMSTDHQQYSTLNQSDKIQEYADKHNIKIIKTYADDGKSGLSLNGRSGLQQLIEDVESHQAEFKIILVYDVSRWGRFQDADESAYYEYICKRTGINIIYCAEQFTNDGTNFSNVMKSFKRTMAGEYSRELSNKVFIGQCRLIEMGFRQGGTAGYGLRHALNLSYRLALRICWSVSICIAPNYSSQTAFDKNTSLNLSTIELIIDQYKNSLFQAITLFNAFQLI